MSLLRGTLARLLSAAAKAAQAPRIDSIVPGQIPIAGGTVVSIEGANFTGARLTLDGIAITPTSASGSTITFSAPQHDNGIVTIAVANTSGTAYGEFLYVPPKLSDLPPGYITTVAGMGFFTGLYRAATRAEVEPAGNPAFDQNGNLYIPEWLNNRIIRLNRMAFWCLLQAMASRKYPEARTGTVVTRCRPK